MHADDRPFLPLILVAAAAFIGIALGWAAIPGPKTDFPVFTIVLVLAAVPVNLASWILLKRRGLRPTVPLPWIVLLVGGVLAILLLGAAVLLALLFGLGVGALLLHAEILLIVYFTVANISARAIFNVIRLVRPAQA